MAVIVGTRYSWTDSANVKRDVSDTLNFLDPRDRTILDLFGPLQSPCTEVKHEWIEKTLRPLDGTIAADSTWANTTDPLPGVLVGTGQGVYLRNGDIILIDSELLQIYNLTNSTDTLSVHRAWGGTTAASHASGAAWHLVGPMVEQDAGLTGARTVTKSGLFNYTQFYEGEVIVTTTQQSIGKFTEQSDFDAQTVDEIKNAWQTYERSLLVGRKVQPVSGTPGAMDGLLARITTNAYPKSGAGLTEAMFLKALGDSYDAGGRINKAVCGRFQKQVMNSFLDAMRLTTRTDTTAGATVDRYTWDGGAVDIVLSRTMSLLQPDTVLLLETDKLGFGPFADHQLHQIELPQVTGTKRTNQILGQYTSEIRNENAHAKITGLATS